MEYREASLSEILDGRERRVHRQEELQVRYGKTLICFTMNIAGPVKNSDLIRWGFGYGSKILAAQLAGEGIPVCHREDHSEVTGCEGYWVVDASPERVKALTVQIEDHNPTARLFDMDVLSPSGEKIQRQALGFPRRKCLICDHDAVVCGRSRAHSVAALQEKTTQLLTQAREQELAREIARQACRALLYEVCVTPKPGLVDRANSGSHRDMDVFTFMSSASALWPYFEECARIGIQTAEDKPEETFRRLRFAGRLAEREMYGATGGVNTHKGAIFTMGILCGAAGRLDSCRLPQPGQILAECAAMTRGLTRRDFSGVTESGASTAGQKFYVQYGIGGIRAEAEAGFPAVLQVGLPVLEEGIRQGLSVNDAGCAVLLHMMAVAADTNLIARSSLERQRQVCDEVRTLLGRNPYPGREELEKLDRAFTEENLSPGGSADLLAATLFLYFLKNAQ